MTHLTNDLANKALALFNGNKLAKVEPKKDIVARSNDSIVVRDSPHGIILGNQTKEITIGGKKEKITAAELMRMIKHVTQNIGEYKGEDNPYSKYVVMALRKARNDMVSDLGKAFKIHWQLDPQTGQSVFLML